MPENQKIVAKVVEDHSLIEGGESKKNYFVHKVHLNTIFPKDIPFDKSQINYK